jgi:hypothetical protein
MSKKISLTGQLAGRIEQGPGSTRLANSQMREPTSPMDKTTSSPRQRNGRLFRGNRRVQIRLHEIERRANDLT